MNSRKYIKILICTFSLMLSTEVSAQVDAQFTQYWAVPTYYNPAATGSIDFVRIVGGTRMQWVGIPKAPKTFLIAADAPFKLFGKRIGAGVVVSQETIGLYSTLTANAQISYKLKLLKGVFSIGLQLGMLDESFKGSEVKIPTGDDAHDTNDEGIPTTDVHGTAFDANFGVYYTHKYFWAGISGTHLLQPTITMNAEGSEEKIFEAQAGRMYYFMAGSNIPIKNTLFELQPSLMVKSNFKLTQAEITARVRYKKFLSGGIAYRWKDAVSVMLGAEYKNFFLGYSFDYPVSAISKVSNGSHEVFVGYNLKLDLSDKNKNKHKSIRIM
ncbi:MAG: type IX secretion system membrane protein PorP/SprF [Muribaculaceae bacterium]